MKRTQFLERMPKRFFMGIALTLLSLNFLAAQTHTYRIVNYNIEDDTDGNTTPLPGLIAPYNNSTAVGSGGVLEGIGEEIVNGDPAQPIDILALEETTSNPTTVQPIVNGLNTFYSSYNYLYSTPAGYAMSPYQATQYESPIDGGGPNALVYNTNTLQLLASVGIATPTGNANGMWRQCVRYEFAPANVAPGTNNEFYVYVSHYKASSGSANDTARLGEARIIRNDESTNVPANAGVLYVGDYNPDDNSGEPGYQTICSNNAPDGIGQGQGVDPLNIQWTATSSASPNINWSSTTTSTNILFMLSEESYELRYRDDLQVMTSNMYYQVSGGLCYVPGTYHSFGNNARIAWGQSVTTSSALSDLDAVKVNITGLTATMLLTDLTDASDHLPIVADYTISLSAPPPPAPPPPAPVISSVSLNGNDLSLNVANAVTNAVYTVLASPGLTSGWTPVATNVAPGSNFSLTLTNAFNNTSPQQFYLLETP
jgi:hypothetical protein